MTDAQPGWIIAAAVKSELQGILRQLGALEHRRLRQGELWEGRWKQERLWIVRTGIGPEKVARVLEQVAASRPCRGLLSVGYAGALREQVRVGDLLIPAELRSIPPLPEESFVPDGRLFQRVCDAARRSGRPFHVDRMLTVDRVITESAEKRRLGRLYDAGSVEMESSVAAGLAARRSIPFLAIRVVSDTAAFSLPDLSFLGTARRKQVAGMVRYVVCRPLQAMRLVTLRRYGKKASRSLTGFLGGEVLDALVG